MRVYYNSYERETKSWLQHYVEWQTFVGNQELILQDLKMELSLDPVPKTTHFGFDAGGGGWEKPSPEYVAVSEKMEKERMYKTSLEQVRELKTKIKIMDRCLSSLSGTEEKILRWKICNNQKWEAIAREVGYNEKTCRTMGRKALGKMARMIFGPKAGPSQTNLNFLPCNVELLANNG